MVAHDQSFQIVSNPVQFEDAIP